MTFKHKRYIVLGIIQPVYGHPTEHRPLYEQPNPPQHVADMLGHLSAVNCLVLGNEPLLRHPLAAEMSSNDGKTTIIVHSTTLDTANRIQDEGYRFTKYGPPSMDSTAFMLESPTSVPHPHQDINDILLAYRYRQRYGAKVVMRIPVARPDEVRNADQTLLTPLAMPELSKPGPIIQPVGRTGTEWLVRNRFVEGHFDQKSGEFVPNPAFDLVSPLEPYEPEVEKKVLPSRWQPATPPIDRSQGRVYGGKATAEPIKRPDGLYVAASYDPHKAAADRQKW